MSKIFKRESLQSRGIKLKVDNNRKRNIIVNFRMSPEEKSLLEEKIALSGLNKQDYMIQMSITIALAGNPNCGKSTLFNAWPVTNILVRTCQGIDFYFS